MCGKMGGNEVESMQNMMSMAVYCVIADALDVDIDDLEPETDLQRDLGLTSSVQEILDQSIMDMFDNFHVDFSRVKTVQDIVNQVTHITIH